jgi:hypothetical protein
MSGFILARDYTVTRVKMFFDLLGIKKERKWIYSTSSTPDTSSSSRFNSSITG